MILSFHDRCAIRSQSTHSGRLSDSVELFARLINSNGWRFREKTLKGIASLHELYKTAANYRLNEETSGFSVWYKIAHGPSPASPLFAQPFIQTQIKENIKAPRHWPLWGIHRGPVNSPHKWTVTRKMFPFHDVIMGSWINNPVPCPLWDVLAQHYTNLNVSCYKGMDE